MIQRLKLGFGEITAERRNKGRIIGKPITSVSVCLSRPYSCCRGPNFETWEKLALWAPTTRVLPVWARTLPWNSRHSVLMCENPTALPQERHQPKGRTPQQAKVSSWRRPGPGHGVSPWPGRFSSPTVGVASEPREGCREDGWRLPLPPSGPPSFVGHIIKKACRASARSLAGKRWAAFVAGWIVDACRPLWLTVDRYTLNELS